ncbi:hypothetical protein P7K49_026132 [Saguinus oedipus]|uniref:Uncharacterized protein n=1 Tax=Saguinus oedipus TaxID=9490 RepID=A0ABQ9UJ50_SAGOE|nr:hypothetical protein P7K49_026132 [Saguinus oedipus]
MVPRIYASCKSVAEDRQCNREAATASSGVPRADMASAGDTGSSVTIRAAQVEHEAVAPHPCDRNGTAGILRAHSRSSPAQPMSGESAVATSSPWPMCGLRLAGSQEGGRCLRGPLLPAVSPGHRTAETASRLRVQGAPASPLSCLSGLLFRCTRAPCWDQLCHAPGLGTERQQLEFIKADTRCDDQDDRDSWG